MLDVCVVCSLACCDSDTVSFLCVVFIAGVLAENMLFATLDPTTRRIRLPRSTSSGSGSGSGNTGSGGGNGADGEEEEEAVLDANAAGARNKVLLSFLPPMRLLMHHPPDCPLRHSLSLVSFVCVFAFDEDRVRRCC